jgi:hypothetical protein
MYVVPAVMLAPGEPEIVGAMFGGVCVGLLDGGACGALDVASSGPQAASATPMTAVRIPLRHAETVIPLSPDSTLGSGGCDYVQWRAG